MINTTGIQSTGSQGLPGSPSQAAVVDEQDVAQFDAMMAEPGSTSKLDELEAKLKNAKERSNNPLIDGFEKMRITDEINSINKEIQKEFLIHSQNSNNTGVELEKIKKFEQEFEQFHKEFHTSLPNRPILK
jgi:hypothetical protein